MERAGGDQVIHCGLQPDVPTKFRKFGDSLLVSLDEQFFDDGTATRGATVSCGLWDDWRA